MPTRRGHNEGSVYKRANGRWVAALTLPGGKRKSFTGATRAEVVIALEQAKADVRGGLPLIEEKQTIAQFVEHWLEMKRDTVKARTHVTLRTYLMRHIVPTIGYLRLTDLTPQRVQSLYSAKLREGLSKTTVHHLHANLHNLLQDALRMGLVQRNVCELVRAPGIARHEMRVLSPEQARTLLDAATGDRWEALYTLALTTGMRQGELLGLKWQEVHLDEASVVVKQTLARVNGVYMLTEPKTRNSRRRIKLTALAVDALRAHRARQKAQRLLMGPAWQDHAFVFPNEIGNPQHTSSLTKHFFYRLLERADLPRIRFHDLRHTAATLLLGERVNPKIVSEMLGHASVAITLDLYSHVLPDMQQDAAAAMERVLSSVS